jgi:hypothetical protein
MFQSTTATAPFRSASDSAAFSTTTTAARADARITFDHVRAPVDWPGARTKCCPGPADLLRDSGHR